MDLDEISGRTGINIRRLRYVADAAIAPAAAKASAGRGRTRHFSGPEAFAVGLGGAMLNAGLRKEIVKGLMRGVAQLGGHLASAPAEGEVQVLEIADGRYVRALKSQLPSEGPAWKHLASGSAVSKSCRPLAWVAIDVTELRRKLFV